MNQKDYKKILEENEQLKKQLQEAEKAVDTLRQGTVDILFNKQSPAQSSGDMLMYRLLIEKLHEGAAVVNENQIIIYANTQFAQYTHHNLQNLMGSHLQSIIASPAKHTWDEVIQLAGLQSVQSNLAVGSSVYNVSISSFQQQNKKYFSIILSDISQRKRTEEKLKNSETQWRTLIENIPYIISRYNLELQYIYVNRPFEEISGKNASQVLAKKPWEIFNNTPQMQEWMDNLEKVIETRSPVNFYYDYMVRDKNLSFSTSMVPEFDINDRLKSVLTMTKDITEDIKKDNQLIASEVALSTARKERQRLYDLFMEAPSMIGVVKGESLILEFVNKALQQAFPSRNLLNQSLYQVFPELRSHPIKDLLNEVLRTGNTITREEMSITIMDDNGKQVTPTFDFVMQPDVDNEGNIVGIILYGNDVTDKIEAKENLKQKNQQLENANKYLDNFAHTIAHDLRSPISNLHMLFYMFQDSTPEEKDEYTSMMKNSVEKLESTLQGLISIIEIQGNEQVSEQGININQIIENAVQDEKDNITEKDAEINVEVQDNLTINHVKAYVQSTVKNLISNALKYSAPARKPKINITAYQEDGYTLIQVVDNGIGLDIEKYGDLLFQPFKRISKTTEGMGIGLHNTKTMVEKNGGKIEVESQPDEGTTFKVYLKEYM